MSEKKKLAYEVKTTDQGLLEYVIRDGNEVVLRLPFHKTPVQVAALAERTVKRLLRAYEVGFEANRFYSPKCDNPHKKDNPYDAAFHIMWNKGWEDSESLYGDSSSL